jgi:hypothetical protein
VTLVADHLAVAAYAVVRLGDAYVPTFERMEREVGTERRRANSCKRALDILKLTGFRIDSLPLRSAEIHQRS